MSTFLVHLYEWNSTNFTQMHVLIEIKQKTSMTVVNIENINSYAYMNMNCQATPPVESNNSQIVCVLPPASNP